MYHCAAQDMPRLVDLNREQDYLQKWLLLLILNERELIRNSNVKRQILPLKISYWKLDNILFLRHSMS